MKVGIITQTNQKGQLVIPKEYRDELGITQDVLLRMMKRGHGIYIHPIVGVYEAVESDRSSYLAVLKRTQGTWGPETKADKARVARRRKLELQTSQERKQAW